MLNILKKVPNIFVSLPVLSSINIFKSSGVLLMVAAIFSLILNNTALHHAIHETWESKIMLGFGSHSVQFTLHYFVNECLMTLFFVLVGLEIKRELIEGELKSFKSAALPIVAAVGGMLFPALIYTLFNQGTPYSKGWGIPMATDIAFALTVISLLGDKVPTSLKVFLTALAIVDDLGAIVVIALFYSDGVAWVAFGQSMMVYAVLHLMGYVGVRSLIAYAVVGFAMWVLFLPTGIHPTIAGVLFAFAIPLGTAKRDKRSTRTEDDLQSQLDDIHSKLQLIDIKLKRYQEKEEKGKLTEKEEEKFDELKLTRDQLLERIQRVTNELESPLQNMIHNLHPFSSFVIMPLFAFANAGIYLGNFDISNLFSNVALGIMLGLMLGKSLGILFTSWLIVVVGVARKSDSFNWLQFFGMAWLAGIGFTMSIFMSDLSFTSTSTQDTAKAAIFVASVLSGVIGFLILKYSCKEETIIQVISKATTQADEQELKPATGME